MHADVYLGLLIVLTVPPPWEHKRRINRASFHDTHPMQTEGIAHGMDSLDLHMPKKPPTIMLLSLHIPVPATQQLPMLAQCEDGIKNPQRAVVKFKR